MKKILLSITLIALFAATLIGCTPRQEWDQEQREAVREALRSYRQMVYLDELTDAEYLLFIDQVAVELENDYPIYPTFVAMPGVVDTVDMVVVTSIVEELNADVHNLRHIAPYIWLVAEGVLPAGLDIPQQRLFYKCLAGRVNGAYATTAQFFNAILSDTTSLSQIRQMERACANELFNWTITEVEVVESVK